MLHFDSLAFYKWSFRFQIFKSIDKKWKLHNNYVLVKYEIDLKILLQGIS